MSKKLCLSLMMIGFCGLLFAQQVTTNYWLHSFQYSVSLEISSVGHSSFVYGDYGTLQRSETLANPKSSNWGFQSQNFDSNLNLYFYSSRVYSSVDKRFNTPDPKSQYHSSYLFVGADPVNTIDYDGNAGKPLFLYQEEFNKPKGEGLSKMMDNVKGVYGDGAHYVPLSKFLNGEIEDLPEWNGDVFIMAHMGTDAQYPINVESSDKLQKMKTELKHGEYVYAEEAAEQEADLFAVFLNGEYLGAKLKTFSEDMDRPLNCVTLGGCEGEFAAGAVQRGFENLPSRKFHGHVVKASGVQTGYQPVYSGVRSGHAEMQMRFKRLPQVPFREWSYPIFTERKGPGFYPTMRGNEQFRNYVETGSVSERFKNFFTTFKMAY